MKKAKIASVKKTEVPVFDLQAFSKKASWSDFYIQDLADHIAEHEFVAKPHKHDFYLILYVSKGNGVHVIDFIEYPVGTNSLFLMTPGQVHSWTLSKGIKGFVVFFTREFYQMQLHQNSLLDFPFYHALAASPFIALPKVDVISFALNKMFEAYKIGEKPNLRILRAYLEILLLEANKYYSPTEGKGNIHLNTFKIRRLEQLIDENFRTLKSAGEYGELMNLAPGYLNSICKEALGKTLTDLIQQRILLEAKRMFAYSDMNVNEVAAALNFVETSYFVRWFKKNNGNTPEDFRKSLF